MHTLQIDNNLIKHINIHLQHINIRKKIKIILGALNLKISIYYDDFENSII